jgi:hypothetical protein
MSIFLYPSSKKTFVITIILLNALDILHFLELLEIPWYELNLCQGKIDSSMVYLVHKVIANFKSKVELDPRLHVPTNPTKHTTAHVSVEF